jgi:hypothetical protein
MLWWVALPSGLATASLHRALQSLVGKRVVEAITPLSTQAARETRYIVADPHPRFWLALLGPYLPEIHTSAHMLGGGSAPNPTTCAQLRVS